MDDAEAVITGKTKGTTQSNVLDFLAQLELDWWPNLISTVAIIVAASFVKYLINHAINSFKIESAGVRLQLKVKLRNITMCIAVLMILFVWGAELHSLMISLVAIIMALVISLKELILCISGGFLRYTSKSFVVGDRIEVNGVRGIVIDQHLMTTVLLELVDNGSQLLTGKTIILPNAIFLSHHVVNENAVKYIMHTFTIVVDDSGRLEEVEKHMLKCMNDYSKPYIAEAKSLIFKRMKDHNLVHETFEPQITIKLGDGDKLNLMLRVAIKINETQNFEQFIIREMIKLKVKWKQKKELK
ncbi:MAG: mechanosensitive ion channel family protein [Lentisphaeria bacterium]|nr:mechanosensitive ion channel family protein [Lentisphaeria bacterium]